MFETVKRIDLTVGVYPATIFTATGGRDTWKENKSHAHVDFVLRHPDNTACVVAAEQPCEHIMRTSRPESMLEIFGGSGWRSIVIQRMCSLKRHITWDISPWCALSIKATVPEVTSQIRDSYERPMPEVDWIDFDHNDWTFNKMIKSSREKRLFNRAFSAARTWVTMTDSTLYGVLRFEKNRACYGRIFGREVSDWKVYYNELDRIVWEVYGFALERIVVVKGRKCAILVFRRNGERAAVEGITYSTKKLIVEVNGETEMRVDPTVLNPDGVEVPL